MMRSRLRKVGAAVTAAALAVAIVITGTYAWQSISQKALNENDGFINPGGRLHDDFNGENKDIYVENFSKEEEGGVPIYARIRLYEYMEIGEGAGLKGNDPNNKAQSVVPGADIDDLDSWTPHMPVNYEAECSAGDGTKLIHHYWRWEMGGKTVYMPTFNMNKDSLVADINGTYAGGDSDPSTDHDRFSDYHEYQLNEPKTDNAVYDNDDNAQDEGWGVGLGTSYIEVEETHVAVETLDAQVYTMAQWLKMDLGAGDFWVIDVDGWAYWANPIDPGEATGLLLSGIYPNATPDSSWYYGIHAVAQFATVGDWGKANNEAFYEDPDLIPSDNALFLLNTAAGRLPSVRDITIEQGETTYIAANDTLALKATVNMLYPSGDPTETAVYWTIDDESASSQFLNGVFSPTVDMVGKTYTITATSSYNNRISTSIQVLVLPSSAKEIVTGRDGNSYVNYNDNTYQMIVPGVDGGLTTFGKLTSAGEDLTIGNAGDIYTVVQLSKSVPGIGSKLIPIPGTDNCYWAAGPNAMLGTSDDIVVVGDITDPDSIKRSTVTIEGDNEVWAGYTVKLTATTSPDPSCGVSWSLVGDGYASDTNIGDDGTLYVGITEKQNKITVKARTIGMGGVEATFDVTVRSSGLSDITTNSPDNVSNGVQNVARGMTMQFFSTPDVKDPLYTVTWSVKTATGAACRSTINQQGLLSVAFDNNEPAGTELIVTATLSTGAKKEMKVTVQDWVIIDGEIWWVIVKDGNNVLLLHKNGVDVYEDFEKGAINWFQDELTREYYTGEWLDSMPKLKGHAQAVEHYSTNDLNATSWNTSTDKVFILSEADLFGTFNGGQASDSRHYTYNGQKLPLESYMRTSFQGYVGEWLRSVMPNPKNTTHGMDWGFHSINDQIGNYFEEPSCYRPAMWVNSTVQPD